MSALSVTPPLVISASTILPLLCILAVGLRFYTRHAQHLALQLDDWLTVPALILTIGMGATLIAGVAIKGFAYPTPPPQDPKNPLASSNHVITVTGQVEWSFQLMQVLGLGLVKLSFVLFCQRIFSVGGKLQPFNVVAICINTMTIVWTIGFFFAFLFICKGRFAALWTTEKSIKSECVKTVELNYAVSISDFLMDLIVISLPIPMVWKLQMSLRKRLAVIGVFSLGLVVVVASVMRMAAFIQALPRNISPSNHKQITANDYKVAFKPSFDNQLLVSTCLYWSMVESGLALIAVCLPSVYYLFRRASPVTTGLSKRSPAFSQLKETQGSEINLANLAHGRSQLAQVETYAMSDVESKCSQARDEAGNDIWVNNTIMQHRDMV